ncbi:MAG: hypothetical protein N3D10_03695 [Candidatus Micrarchaeota archaeon]|nr:hypothetical protein [Candidatus Micrarchaeota archaeon]
MEKLQNFKKLIFLYIFWFFVIAFVWVVGEYFLFSQPFYSSVYLLNNHIPAAFVYALFLAVAFAIFQYILSPRPLHQTALSSPASQEQTTQIQEQKEKPESSTLEQDVGLEQIQSITRSKKKPKKKLKKQKSRKK